MLFFHADNLAVLMAEGIDQHLHNAARRKSAAVSTTQSRRSGAPKPT
jgi:hypothetical protein